MLRGTNTTQADCVVEVDLNRSEETAKPPEPNAITVENETTTQKCAEVRVAKITRKRAEKNQAVEIARTKLCDTHHALQEKSRVATKTALDEFATFDKGTTTRAQKVYTATQITNLSMKILPELYNT